MNQTQPTDNIAQLQKQIFDLKSKLAKIDFNNSALKALNEELSAKLDIGEAIDTVNKFLWEMIDYSVSEYIVFNMASGEFESRAYVKESVDSKYLRSMKSQLIDFIHEHSKDSTLGASTSVTQINPLLFGLPLDENKTTEMKSSFVLPLSVGGKIIGALCISSTKPDLYTDQEKSLVDSFLVTASVSIARIETLMQSMHSRTEALVQSLSNGVIMFDPGRNVSLANPAASRFTGLPKEGYSLDELSKLFTDVDLNTLIDETLTTGKISYVAKASLAQFYYEIFIVPVTNYADQVLGGAVILHDITQTVKVDQAKTEFVSLASHQLRTPLSAIKWYSEIVLDDAGNLTPDQIEQLKAIQESNQRMIDLVDALLNVSRLELGTFSIEPEETDVVAISKSVVAELQGNIQKKQINLQESYAADIPKMMLDPKLTRIIFQNLASNAVKYTPDQGQVSIGLKMVQVESNSLDKIPIEGIQLQVSDTGIGIPGSQQSKIFSKLFRADNAKAGDVEGTGLGLYVIKSIVDHVGGKISFTSKENQGTTFEVFLPKGGMPQKTGTKELK